MIFIAILAACTAIYLLQDKGEISLSSVRKSASLAISIISGVLFCVEYGALRGIFILIGVVSLLGTLFTLLRYKLRNTD